MNEAGTTHPLVTDYLTRLRQETRRLPDDQARELVDAAGGATVANPARARRHTGRVEAGAVLALVAAELLVIFWPLGALAWLVGVTLLMVSSGWTRRQWTRAFLSLATGFPLAIIVLVYATIGGSTTTVMLVALGLYLVWQVITARALLKNPVDHTPEGRTR